MEAVNDGINNPGSIFLTLESFAGPTVNLFTYQTTFIQGSGTNTTTHAYKELPIAWLGYDAAYNHSGDAAITFDLYNMMTGLRNAYVKALNVSWSDQDTQLPLPTITAPGTLITQGYSYGYGSSSSPTYQGGTFTSFNLIFGTDWLPTGTVKVYVDGFN